MKEAMRPRSASLPLLESEDHQVSFLEVPPLLLATHNFSTCFCANLKSGDSVSKISQLLEDV